MSTRPGQTRSAPLRRERQFDRLARLDAEDQLVGPGADEGTHVPLALDRAEQVERRLLELDRDLGDSRRQPLARAQVERHAGPAPVVNEYFHRDKRLGA